MSDPGSRLRPLLLGVTPPPDGAKRSITLQFIRDLSIRWYSIMFVITLVVLAVVPRAWPACVLLVVGAAWNALSLTRRIRRLDLADEITVVETSKSKQAT